MLELKLNNKSIRGERVTLELLYNNLTGLGFKHHPGWQLEFDDYLREVSGVLHLSLRSGSPIVLIEPISGVVLAKSEVGGELSH